MLPVMRRVDPRRQKGIRFAEVTKVFFNRSVQVDKLGVRFRLHSEQHTVEAKASGSDQFRGR